MSRDLKEMAGVKEKLAVVFCEDTNTFNLQDCLKNFHDFCTKFSKAVKENKERALEDEKKRKQEERRLASKFHSDCDE